MKNDKSSIELKYRTMASKYRRKHAKCIILLLKIRLFFAL